MDSPKTEEESKNETTGPFETPDDTTDVIFVVEDRKLYFNKTILMMCSPVFKCMFTSSFQEKEAKEIPLPDKKYEDVVVFFEQIHPVYSPKPITERTFAQILPLADEYQAKPVLEKCDQYILAQLEKASSLTTTQLLFYLWLCEKHLQKHRQRLLRMAAHRKSWDVQNSRYYQRLPQTTTMDIMTTRCLKLDEFLHEYSLKRRPTLGFYRNEVPRLCTECRKSLNEGLESHMSSLTQ